MATTQSKKDTTGDSADVPIPITLDGKEYMLSPMVRGDYKKFLAWVKSEHIELGQQTAKGMDVEVQKYLMSETRKEVAAMTWTSTHVLRQMADLEGSIFLIWLGIQHCHPEVTREQVCSWLKDDTAYDSAIEAYDRLQGLQEDASPVKKCKAPRKKGSTKVQQRKKTRKKKASR